MIHVKKPVDPVLAGFLSSHPMVTLVDGAGKDALVFVDEGRERRVYSCGHGAEVRGLVELIDNNPMVCADTVCVPSPDATLASAALGPLLRAGLVVSDPALHVSQPLDDGDDLMWSLESLGWDGGVSVGLERMDFGRVRVLNAMVEVPLMDDYSAIDDLYEEAFGRSFYVRQIVDGEWDTQVVSGRPFMAYHLRLTEGEETALLTIRTMADRDGKVGACQVLHAMNVMAGFEETLGIPAAF